MKTNNILEQLTGDDAFIGIQRKELENCLQHIQNRKLPEGKMIVILGGAYYLAQ